MVQLLALGASERLQLPDVHQLGRMPSLPEWVALRIASVKDETQRSQDGKWRTVPTIRSNWILSPMQRDQIEHHAAALEGLYEQTPRDSKEQLRALLVALTKFMWVCSSMAQNELSAEARGEAFVSVVDDLPLWATESAIRKWCRGDCGTDARGRPYDYHWCPAPAELRRVAMSELWLVKGRARDLRRLLSAEPRTEYSAEYCREMRERLAGLWRPGTSLVGRNGSGEGGRRSVG
jgi:hypothetical protein